jgi:polyisoprenoid-binding protein YceI
VAAVGYKVDPGVSRFTVKAFATGLLSAFGHSPTLAIRQLSGRIMFAPETPAECSVELTIQAGSLTVQDDVSSKDRREIERVMNEEILESARYPEIRFESADVELTPLGETRYAARIKGRLTLHGVTRDQVLGGTVTLLGDMARVSGECSVLQSHYGIKLVNVAAGAIKVKDELKAAFELVARKEA